MISDSLFQGALVRLAAFEPERDAEVESRWTHDAEYLRLLGAEPARPLSPFHIKKMHESMEKEHDPHYFTVRTLGDDRLVGFVQFGWIQWSHGGARIWMGIGLAEDRGRGFGREALQLALRYAFAELNLYRITAIVAEYNPRALHLFERAGFKVEGRRRQALNREGRRWDELRLGLLREEWEENKP